MPRCWSPATISAAARAASTRRGRCSDFGIRCVISTSFGDIFYNNCFKNGILPIRVTQDDLDKLFDDAERGANATLTIDLANQEIRGPDGGKVKFEIDPFRKHCLMNGLDDIGLTMEKKSSIDDYEAKAEERARLGLIVHLIVLREPRSHRGSFVKRRRRGCGLTSSPSGTARSTGCG